MSLRAQFADAIWGETIISPISFDFDFLMLCFLLLKILKSLPVFYFKVYFTLETLALLSLLVSLLSSKLSEDDMLWVSSLMIFYFLEGFRGLRKFLEKFWSAIVTFHFISLTLFSLLLSSWIKVNLGEGWGVFSIWLVLAGDEGIGDGNYMVLALSFSFKWNFLLIIDDAFLSFLSFRFIFSNQNFISSSSFCSLVIVWVFCTIGFTTDSLTLRSSGLIFQNCLGMTCLFMNSSKSSDSITPPFAFLVALSSLLAFDFSKFCYAILKQRSKFCFFLSSACWDIVFVKSKDEILSLNFFRP